MMLKSVEKLRKKLEEDTAGDFVFTTYPEQHGFRAGATIENYEAIADEIEQEVSERFMELPLDAEGVPIRVGDVMETEDNYIRKVDTMQVSSRKWSIGLVATLDAMFSWHDADRLRHHHEPTVEDVLREFSEKMNENLGMYTGEAIDADEWRQADSKTIAEYAEKLRLAGGE